jgi:hypothetical protein
MKIVRFLPFVFLLALLSCASAPLPLPAPADEQSSLVIGNMRLDFPDGFFDKGPRTLTSNISLWFVDPSGTPSIKVRTTVDGYFYFLCPGGGRWKLDRYFDDVSEGGSYRIDGRPGYSFDVPPGSVVYLGHMVWSFTRPKDLEQYNHVWEFGVAFSRDDCRGATTEYLRVRDEQTPWLDLEMLASWEK